MIAVECCKQNYFQGVSKAKGLSESITTVREYNNKRIAREYHSPKYCREVLTLSNMNISETQGPIATKFYLKHHWLGGKDAIGFGPDRIRTLVPMAMDSSHRVIMGKML